MDRHELFDRLRQYLTARADVLRYGSGHDFAATRKSDRQDLRGAFSSHPRKFHRSALC